MSDQPQEPSGTPPRQILVAVDRSQAAAEAAVLAYEVFGENAEYTVVSVAKGDAAALRDSGDIPTTIPFDMVAATERGEAQETAAAIGAHSLGGRARTAGLVSPRPGILICEIARKMDADFIVIGSPSRGRWRQLVVRSVGEYITRKSPCPVLVAVTPSV